MFLTNFQLWPETAKSRGREVLILGGCLVNVGSDYIIGSLEAATGGVIACLSSRVGH